MEMLEYHVFKMILKTILEIIAIRFFNVAVYDTFIADPFYLRKDIQFV